MASASALAASARHMDMAQELVQMTFPHDRMAKSLKNATGDANNTVTHQFVDSVKKKSGCPLEGLEIKVNNVVKEEGDGLISQIYPQLNQAVINTMNERETATYLNNLKTIHSEADMAAFAATPTGEAQKRNGEKLWKNYKLAMDKSKAMLQERIKTKTKAALEEYVNPDGSCKGK